MYIYIYGSNCKPLPNFPEMPMRKSKNYQWGNQVNCEECFHLESQCVFMYVKLLVNAPLLCRPRTVEKSCNLSLPHYVMICNLVFIGVDYYLNIWLVKEGCIPDYLNRVKLVQPTRFLWHRGAFPITGKTLSVVISLALLADGFLSENASDVSFFVSQNNL